jgi:hypothetical protein
LTLRRLSLRLLALSLCTFARLLILAESLVSVKLPSGNCSNKTKTKKNQSEKLKFLTKKS